MRILVVTNDFPPKHGGIQLFHRDLWTRFPPDEVVVLTTSYEGDAAYDRTLPFRVVRDGKALLPTPALARRVRALADEIGADLVVVDPPIPVGLAAGRMGRPYAVIVHGGVVLQTRTPGMRDALRRVVAGATGVLAAGTFPADEVRRVAGDRVPITVVHPGVDLERFRPLGAAEIGAVRRRFGLPEEGRVVLSVSRLVPRKGMDVLIDAAALLGPGRRDLIVAIGGKGRDRDRLARRAASSGAPVRFLGSVSDDDLPALYGCADVFVMLCRNRWGGLEQEGFGMVFLEAAACGVPQVAGLSGGSADAVVDGETGAVVRDPRDVTAAAAAIARLLDHPDRRRAMGLAARARAERDFGWDTIAARARTALASGRA